MRNEFNTKINWPKGVENAIFIKKQTIKMNSFFWVVSQENKLKINYSYQIMLDYHHQGWNFTINSIIFKIIITLDIIIKNTLKFFNKLNFNR